MHNVTAAEVFRGYLPSSALVQSTGLYQACGILGATVMPHSLYLGSGLVQDRLRELDTAHRRSVASTAEPKHLSPEDPEPFLLPCLSAIRACRAYAITELATSLFLFALFVNSAILIVAGDSLYGVAGADGATLFQIYHLLNESLAPAAGTVFAVALLLSGTSAGIICTIAGQMLAEGQLDLKMKPWKRRLFTRSISIVPSIIVAGALGGDGLSKALVGSQVALSIILPFVSAPLIWFTIRSKYMTVCVDRAVVQRGVLGMGRGDAETEAEAENGVDGGEGSEGEKVNMRVHPVVAFFAVLIWGVIVFMNGALLVLLILGKG
jgi:metal iron transporter